MNLLHAYGWRIALVLSAVTLVVGGRMHPSADAEDPLSQELATMTASDGWVLGHSLTVISTVLLVAALWLAYRQNVWPAIRRPLLLAALAFSLYAVETVFHLLAFIDADALAHGHTAPFAMGHIGLGVVLYPIAGTALVYLSWSMGRAAGGWRRIPMVIGIVAGSLHALSVPLSLILPNTELSPMFAGAAMLIALWTLILGVTGSPRVVESRRAQAAALV